MFIRTFLAAILLMILMPIDADLAIAGSSIDDGFSAIDKERGHLTSSAIGVGAGFRAMDQGSRKADVTTGHGIEAEFQGIATNRAEQAVIKAESERKRMEEEATKQDSYAASNCDCKYGELADGRCASGITMVMHCYGVQNSWGGREEISCASPTMGEDERQASAAAKAEKHRICAAWKAEGPKANSASFKAQLAKQYDAIAASRLKWEEEDRQRNALIRADIKKAKELAEKEEKAKQDKIKDAEIASIAAEKARAQKAEAAREEENHKWCMAQSDLMDCRCVKYLGHKVSACRH